MYVCRPLFLFCVCVCVCMCVFSIIYGCMSWLFLMFLGYGQLLVFDESLSVQLVSSWYQWICTVCIVLSENEYDTIYIMEWWYNRLRALEFQFSFTIIYSKKKSLTTLRVRINKIVQSISFVISYIYSLKNKTNSKYSVQVQCMREMDKARKEHLVSIA